jgi:hypothetical protein
LSSEPKSPAPRFLIDENLSVELPAIAHAAGYACQHVNGLGLRTKGDPVLMKRILDEEWTLVTNDWREFLARYKANDTGSHPGFGRFPVSSVRRSQGVASLALHFQSKSPSVAVRLARPAALSALQE